jgi:hypothetical protein
LANYGTANIVPDSLTIMSGITEYIKDKYQDSNIRGLMVDEEDQEPVP